MEIRPRFATGDASALNGTPVLGTDWGATAAALNWIRGRGGVLVPAYDPAMTLLPDDVGTAALTDFNFRVMHRYPAFARVWVVGIRRTSALVGDRDQGVTLSAPAGSGTPPAQAVSGNVLDTASTLIYVERLSAQVVGEQDVSLRIGIGSDPGETSEFDPFSIACFELPRNELLLSSATDAGVDADTIRALQAIYDGSSGESVAGTGDTLIACEAQSMRGGLMAWNVPDDYGPSTAATWADFFTGSPPCYAHCVSGVTKTVKPRVRAKCSGTATGEVRITTRLGATATIAVTGTTWAYFGSGTVALDAEDVFASDGRRGAPASEAVRWEWRQSGGAGNLYVSGLYLLDG